MSLAEYGESPKDQSREDDRTKNYVDSASCDRDRVHLFSRPSRCPVGILQTLEEQIKVVVSVWGEHCSDV